MLPRQTNKTFVIFVCLGNICRSPMAEVKFKKMVIDDNLQNKIHVSSDR
ncbi:hypothetical protein GKC44_05835, partial [Lactobacillus parabuchneri]|nr:hypothetical protein [Lentilactobacillus parabuchneri]